MERHFVEVDFNPDMGSLLARLGLAGGSGGSGGADEFLALFERARPFARPRAFLGVAAIDGFDGGGGVTIGGVPFHGPLLAENLGGLETVWPYLATCGRELYDFAQAIPDPFERYWADEILREALDAARAALDDFLIANLYAGKTASMNPGALEGWPIAQQVPFFHLVGDAAEKCGVILTDSLLMLPSKSVSGIRFPNERGFVGCRLCPREKCPVRRAEYDPGLSR